jgi:hypothetical protein
LNTRRGFGSKRNFVGPLGSREGDRLTREGGKEVQVFDNQGRIKELLTGNLEELVTKGLQAIKDPDTKMVVISMMPKLGDDVFFNNLKFRVKSVLSRNRFVIQLVGPADEEVEK